MGDNIKVDKINPTEGTSAFSHGLETLIEVKNNPMTIYVKIAIIPLLVNEVSHALSVSTLIFLSLIDSISFFILLTSRKSLIVGDCMLFEFL